MPVNGCDAYQRKRATRKKLPHKAGELPSSSWRLVRPRLRFSPVGRVLSQPLHLDGKKPLEQNAQAVCCSLRRLVPHRHAWTAV